MLPSLAFTQNDAVAAFNAWHCNCGPAALAASLGLTLDQVKPAVMSVGFADKHYVNPTMMRGALKFLGATVEALPSNSLRNFPSAGLARIQWTGPWTEATANPRWGYRQTHWVASWLDDGPLAMHVFDVNFGIVSRRTWEEQCVPWIIKQCVPRADGGWYITHSWEIKRGKATPRVEEGSEGRSQEGVGNHAATLPQGGRDVLAVQAAR